LEARAADRRRRAREVPTHPLPDAVAPQPAGADFDALDILDEEIARLPEGYRAAVVLCELEGRPRKDAALRLGVPEGTLSSRLAAARKLLAQRLARRGPVLALGALAGAGAPAGPRGYAGPGAAAGV